MSLAEYAAPYVLAFVLALAGEGFVEFTFSGLSDWLKLKPNWLEFMEYFAPLKYIAMVIGILLAFAYELDLVRELTGYVAVVPWVGVLLTGYIVGRGANFVHDFVGKFLRKAPAA